MTEVGSGVTEGYLLLADISGYTEFMTGTELEHSHSSLLIQVWDARAEHEDSPLTTQVRSTSSHCSTRTMAAAMMTTTLNEELDDVPTLGSASILAVGAPALVSMRA